MLPNVTVATQNVDGLHLRAGSKNVRELHGHLRKARCTGCDALVSLERGLDLDRIDHACGGRFRPQVLWFGEALPASVWQRAEEAATEADVVLVVGTSARVYPAASLATLHGGAFVAEINPNATSLRDCCDCAIREGAATALPELVSALRAVSR